MSFFSRKLLVLGYVVGIVAGLVVFVAAFSTNDIAIEFVVLVGTIIEAVCAQLFTRKLARSPRNEIASGALRGFGWPTIVLLFVALAALFFAYL
jgi:hypothetical protein